MKVNRKRAKVHMLPTDMQSVALLSKRKDDGLLQAAKGINGVANCNPLWTPQHLYITTDEEIKEGDWIYWADPEGLTSDINQVISIDEEMIFLSHPEHSETEALPSECRKIIASTNKSLTIGGNTGKREDGIAVPLPQPSQAFIRSYVKNPFDKVIIEYERQTNKGEWKDVLLPSEWGDSNPTRPKLNTDGTLAVSLVEEKMYSKDEFTKWNQERLNAIKEVESLISAVNTFISCMEDNPFITDQIPQDTIKQLVPEIRNRIDKVEKCQNKRR